MSLTFIFAFDLVYESVLANIISECVPDLAGSVIVFEL